MRRTFVLRDGKLVPKETAAPLRTEKSIHVIPDVEPFVSPIDNTIISSRSHIREHEQRHGVRQVGNDWKPPMMERN